MSSEQTKVYTPKDIESYYDEYTETYINTTGDYIQAFRTADTNALMQYVLNASGIKNGMNILDAGCGVGAPAIWLASNLPDTTITAITTSDIQCSIAKQKVQAAGLEDRIEIKKSDYHNLSTDFPAAKFDAAIFLESLGHSHNTNEVFKGLRHVLKSGGIIYIKDFFRKHSHDNKKQSRINDVVNTINESYCYNTLNLAEVIKNAINNDVYIRKIEQPAIAADIAITVAFENKTGKLTYPSYADFTATDWYEIIGITE